jgi:hypothetical protein
MLYSTFEKPEYQKSILIKNEQHYAACTWRGKTYVMTDRGKRLGDREKNRLYVLCVSQDGYGVMSDCEGNFLGDPFKVPDDKFKEITGREPVNGQQQPT